LPSWSALAKEAEQLPQDAAIRGAWVQDKSLGYLQDIARICDRNVIAYASGFLQKPTAANTLLAISPEDINAFMAALHGMDWSKGLSLVLHTPGGAPGAAETIVEYLHSKFARFEVIVPTYSLSAGTMIALAADHLYMGRQSQLGPTDPQLLMQGRAISAQSVLDQFAAARGDILLDPKVAPAYMPLLGAMAPSLVQEARYAIDYTRNMVERWLTRRSSRGGSQLTGTPTEIAAYFGDASTHKSHGRRIGRDEVRSKGLSVDDLEANQDLQEAVLSLYHMLSITFERGPAAKIVMSNAGAAFVKNGEIKPAGKP
jgi:hypothetical protein